MDDRSDAFGRLLLDHLEGKDGRAVLEFVGGYVQPALEAEVFFAPCPAWPAEEQAAMRFVRGRVLDLGCGAGRHALYLQERGHDVVAVDVSPGALEVTP